MREKSRIPAHGRRRPAKAGSSSSIADWLLLNETGWGMPHMWIALVAAVAVGIRCLAAFIDRRSRGGAGDTSGPPAETKANEMAADIDDRRP
jgi:hypothetical protein